MAYNTLWGLAQCFIAFWHGQPAGGGQRVDDGGQSVDGGGQRARENVLNNILSVMNGQIL